MERVNQELEQYLWIFVNQRQDDWTDLLPLAEFQYNNHIHSSTQQPPFFLESGRLPWMGFEPNQHPSRIESVNEFTERMKNTLEEVKVALVKSKDDMARYYNQRRTPAPVMRMEFSYTWKTTIFTFLCILALSTAYLRTGYASTQGYTSTTLAPSDVILPRDWSLFL